MGTGKTALKMGGWSTRVPWTARTSVWGFTAVEPCKSTLLGPLEPRVPQSSAHTHAGWRPVSEKQEQGGT